MADSLIPNQDTLITITADVADRLLALRSADAVLLYLYFLRRGAAPDQKALAALGLQTPVSACMELLARAGLIQLPEADAAVPVPPQQASEIPEYTAEEVLSRTERDECFRSLLRETADRLGRPLSGADMKILFGIYDYLGLPADVILLLLNWCIRETQRKFGPGRLPTLRQIEKEAYLWAREELFSLELADRYLQTRSTRHSECGEIAGLLGIRDRSLSVTEEKMIVSWLDMGFRREAILLAYDKTVLKKGELAWRYMNRILESWHQKGLHTIPEIEAGDRPAQPRSGAAQKPAEKPEADDLRRMQSLIEKMNGGGRNGT